MKHISLKDLNHFKIAIIDDDEASLKAIERTLECFDFDNFRSFGTGEEFFNKLNPNKPFDLILLDMVIEHGMSGLEILEELNKSKQIEQVEVLVHTAYPEHIKKIMSFKKGACSYITKPFDMNELVLKVEIILTRLERMRR